MNTVYKRPAQHPDQAVPSLSSPSWLRGGVVAAQQSTAPSVAAAATSASGGAHANQQQQQQHQQSQRQAQARVAPSRRAMSASRASQLRADGHVSAGPSGVAAAPVHASPSAAAAVPLKSTFGGHSRGFSFAGPNFPRDSPVSTPRPRQATSSHPRSAFQRTATEGSGSGSGNSGAEGTAGEGVGTAVDAQAFLKLQATVTALSKYLHQHVEKQQQQQTNSVSASNGTTGAVAPATPSKSGTPKNAAQQKSSSWHAATAPAEAHLASSLISAAWRGFATRRWVRPQLRERAAAAEAHRRESRLRHLEETLALSEARREAQDHAARFLWQEVKEMRGALAALEQKVAAAQARAEREAKRAEKIEKQLRALQARVEAPPPPPAATIAFADLVPAEAADAAPTPTTLEALRLLAELDAKATRRQAQLLQSSLTPRGSNLSITTTSSSDGGGASGEVPYVPVLHYHEEAASLHGPHGLVISPEAEDILTHWLHTHKHHPYPELHEKLSLASLTRLPFSGVERWFIEARMRLLASPRTRLAMDQHFEEERFRWQAKREWMQQQQQQQPVAATMHPASIHTPQRPLSHLTDGGAPLATGSSSALGGSFDPAHAHAHGHVPNATASPSVTLSLPALPRSHAASVDGERAAPALDFAHAGASSSSFASVAAADDAQADAYAADFAAVQQADPWAHAVDATGLATIQSAAAPATLAAATEAVVAASALPPVQHAVPSLPPTSFEESLAPAPLRLSKLLVDVIQARDLVLPGSGVPGAGAGSGVESGEMNPYAVLVFQSSRGETEAECRTSSPQFCTSFCFDVDTHAVARASAPSAQQQTQGVEITDNHVAITILSRGGMGAAAAAAAADAAAEEQDDPASRGRAWSASGAPLPPPPPPPAPPVDVVLGSVVIPLSTLRSQLQCTAWFPLVGPAPASGSGASQQRGQVQLALQWLHDLDELADSLQGQAPSELDRLFSGVELSKLVVHVQRGTGLAAPGAHELPELQSPCVGVALQDRWGRALGSARTGPGFGPDWDEAGGMSTTGAGQHEHLDLLRACHTSPIYDQSLTLDLDPAEDGQGQGQGHGQGGVHVLLSLTRAPLPHASVPQRVHLLGVARLSLASYADQRTRDLRVTMQHPDTGAPVATLHLSLLWLHHLPSLIAQLQADHKAAGAQLTASPAMAVIEQTSAATAPLAEASAASLTALAALAEQPGSSSSRSMHAT